LAENLRLVILLDAEALSRMKPPETLLERSQHVFVACRHGSNFRPVERCTCIHAKRISSHSTSAGANGAGAASNPFLRVSVEALLGAGAEATDD
jgi:hypothetical protein